MLSLNQIDTLVGQRRQNWDVGFAVYDIYKDLEAGKQFEGLYHITPEDLHRIHGYLPPNLDWFVTGYSIDYFYLLKRKGWWKIKRDLWKFHRRGRKHGLKAWRKEVLENEKAVWDKLIQDAKNTGNYLSI